MTKEIHTYTKKIRALYGYKDALPFFLYAQARKKEFLRWLEFINTRLPDSFDEKLKARLALRGARRFLRRWMSLKEKLDILTCHYTLMIKHFSSTSLTRMFRPGIDLAELSGKSGSKYNIRILSEISKDGCLIIFLRGTEEDASRLASITGVIGPDKHGECTFWIGALQGGMPLTREGKQIYDGKQAVARVTKDLNGLRPKQAVLQAAAAIAIWFGIKKIIAPGRKNQIAIKNWRKGSHIHTEYDSFWQEYTGGMADENGDYCITLPIARRSLAEVQQKRRKDWVQRYARIDEMAESIAKTLDCLS